MSFHASRYGSNRDLFEPGQRHIILRFSISAPGKTCQVSSGKNVSDEEVNLVRRIWPIAVSRSLHAVVEPWRGDSPDRLNLDAPKHLTGTDNDIVAVALRPCRSDIPVRRL
jgi:hypothetical protein